MDKNELELTDLRAGMQKILGIAEQDSLIDGIRNKLWAKDRNKVFERYIELVNGDLEIDYLQRIYEYDYADRKEKCQDYTPKSISKLCAALTDCKGQLVYDLCAGSGALTIQKWVQCPEKFFVCEELDGHVIPLLLFNLMVRNCGGYVICRDALSLDFTECYEIKKGKRFSDAVKLEISPNFIADEIISNPPYNIRWNPPTPLLADARFRECPIPPASNANWAFVLTALHNLRPGGKCAFVLPCGVLSQKTEKEIRQYMVDEGLIERIILLPDKMFENTSIPTCVIQFSTGNNGIRMYDCRKSAVQEEHRQRGQYGGASHQNREYVKMINVIPDELIDRVCMEQEDQPGFCCFADCERIKENDYILNCSRYIEEEPVIHQHRPYADIMADINRISAEKSRVKLTINESVAKSLGLYEVAQLEASCDPEKINQTFHLLGGSYQSKCCITLSKNKSEIKIENTDKDGIPSLILMFLPMWKQHLMYCNEEENRLLAELRDAMLPELMDGTIQV